MAGPFKMKGSPMQRNFGIGDKLKKVARGVKSVADQLKVRDVLDPLGLVEFSRSKGDDPIRKKGAAWPAKRGAKAFKKGYNK